MENEVYISSHPKEMELKWKEVWHYRDLVFLMVRKSFKLRYKQTALGPVWIFLQALLPGAAYAVLFGEIAAIGTDGVPGYLFYLLGTALWEVFSATFFANASVFSGNAYVFGKVYFPRLSVPISNMLVQLLIFAIKALLVLAFLLFFTLRGAVAPVWPLWCLLPLIVLQLALMGTAVGLLASSVTIKYKDLSFAFSGVMRLWMYTTPVVYPLSQVKGGLLRRLIWLNPVTAPFECCRYVLFGKGAFMPLPLLASAVFTFILFMLSCLLFNRVERDFIDRI